MQKQTKPQFRAAHPTLADLQTALDLHGAALSSYIRKLDWLARAAAVIDPSRWTEKIEASLDDQQKLEAVRIEFDERSITFMSALCGQRIAWGHYGHRQIALSAAIRSVIEAERAIEDGSAEAWLKPIMRGACILAAEEHRTDPNRGHHRDVNASDQRAEQIMHTAYLALVEQLGQLRRPASYPTDLVVQGREILPYLNRGVELRSLAAVDFVDCYNSEHPANAELARLLSELEIALTEAHEASRSFRADDNGSVNERQHASRLIDQLHGESAGCGVTGQSAVDDQNDRRWRYELARRSLMIGTRQLLQMHQAVAAALIAAVEEAAPLIELTRQRSSRELIITIDQYHTARMIMNNCLSADLRLRTIGRQIKELEGVHNNNLAGSAGLRALDARFDQVAQNYRRLGVPQPEGHAEKS